MIIKPTSPSVGDSDSKLNLRGKVNLSSDVLARVEAVIINQEHRFGRERLLKTVLEIPNEVMSEHVDFYRKIIRSNPWPNEPFTSSFEQFLSDYSCASVAYARTAFDLLDRFPWSDKKQFGCFYRKALGAEALRGQFGKRCKTGLDHRLADYGDKVEALLGGILPEQALSTVVDALCTPVYPALTAESALLEDFIDVKSVFPQSPSLAQILTLEGDAEETVWRFLRRHCRWSLQLLERYYRDFCHPSFAEAVSVTREARSKQLLRKEKFLVALYESCSLDRYNEIIAITEAISDLNHLNLTLEPFFSFKGGPGLIYGLVFRQGFSLQLTTSVSQGQICETKWELFGSE